jgi:hypothetical protein
MKVWRFVTDLWCYMMHPDPMWPVNGQYRCPSCHRLYPVPWEKQTSRLAYQPETKPVSVTAKPRGMAGSHAST